MAGLDEIPTPTIPDDLSNEQKALFQTIINFAIEVIDKWNGGRYKIREFVTTSPVLADMAIGEIAYGVGTGPGGTPEDELFVKTDSASIAVFTEDSVITA